LAKKTFRESNQYSLGTKTAPVILCIKAILLLLPPSDVFLLSSLMCCYKDSESIKKD